MVLSMGVSCLKVTLSLEVTIATLLPVVPIVLLEIGVLSTLRLNLVRVAVTLRVLVSVTAEEITIVALGPRRRVMFALLNSIRPIRVVPIISISRVLSPLVNAVVPLEIL